MGMFDNIIYKGLEYQTKDTPSQCIDLYELRDDGTLWYENYDADWIEGESKFGGILQKNNKRWEPCDHTGIIKFYRNIGKGEWEEFEATVADGKLINLREI